MGKYEYIGKREIMRRVSALGYPVASGKLCSYAKFEGVEWVESEKIKITANQTEEFGNLSGALRGFTLLIEKDSSENENASFQKIYKLVSKLKFESIENKRFFIKGIFDGRGSMDTNSHLIVVDYKLSEDTFQTFSDIVESVGFELTPNKRHDGEARNAQFRIKTSSLKKFNDEIGFFSVRRQNYLNDMLKKLGVDK